MTFSDLSPVHRVSTMNSIRVRTAFFGALASLLLIASARMTPALAEAAPPARLSYQGMLVDANGVALGNTSPKNYDVVFRIYSSSQGDTLLWAEQQTVTVDKGYFSVLLGEGSVVGSEPAPPLPTLFAGPTASDRYVGVTVKGLGTTDTEIAPRLRLMTSPYAFLAQQAVSLVDNAGAPLITGNGGAVGIKKVNPTSELDVNGRVTATAFTGDGAQLTSLNAANVTSGVLHPDRVPFLDAGKVNSGVLSDARLSGNVARLNGGNQSFNGVISAPAFAGDGTVPIGGIIMWSGSTSQIPDGWALCNGQFANGRWTPDLRDRFVVGAGWSYAPGNVGGRTSVQLSVANLPPHSHDYTDYHFAENAGQNWGWPGSRSGMDWDNQGFGYTRTTASTGSASAFDIRPPYYALGFIMRVR